MQKAYSLQPDEQRQVVQLEDEHRTLLAQYGALEIDRRRIRKRLPQIEEQQRALVRTVVGRLGVTQFNAARLEGPNLILDVPGDPQPQPQVIRTNGAAPDLGSSSGE